MIRALSTDLKKVSKKQLSSATSLDKDLKSKNYLYSPEKECSDINALVKQSVDKINNLFNNQLIKEINEKKPLLTPNINYKNKLNSKANFTFNINNFINVRKEDNTNNNIKPCSENYKDINEKEIDDILNKNYKKEKNLSLSQDIFEENKNINKIKEDEINENINFNKSINANSMIDISALKRNIKKHSINLSQPNITKIESRNQFDYINQSNQNQKKYIIKNSYNLINPKNSNIVQKIETNVNLSVLKKKRNFSFNYNNPKDAYNKNSNEKKIQKTQNNESKHKYYNLYKNHFIRRINNPISKNKNTNSTKNINIKNIKKQEYKRSSSNFQKKVIKKRNYFKSKEETLENSAKNSQEFFRLNNRLENDFKNKKLYSSTPIVKSQKSIYKNKSQNQFNNKSNILKRIYSKEFPSKIKTNDVLKLMLFLNEYIINNNLLDDYYIPQNRKNLDDLSIFLSSKIKSNYPRETDISIDNVVKKTKIIQRFWRKRKIKNYIKQKNTGIEEEKEIKKMIVNDYIDKSGFKTKKILGLFHNMLENFCDTSISNIYNIGEDNNNKTFYYIQKLIMKDLTSFERNELFKDYINKVIFKK